MPVELDYWAQNLKKVYSERDHNKEIVLRSSYNKSKYQKSRQNSYSIFETD
ncbi:MAG: hypothetical protein HZR80_19685 [Candidatus Heimdallarchaeota archaeon]